MINVVYSLMQGQTAGPNPWGATTLEWQTPQTPPVHGNWGPKLPVVYRWAYDYSVPGEANDFIPQNEPPKGHNVARLAREPTKRHASHAHGYGHRDAYGDHRLVVARAAAQRQAVDEAGRRTDEPGDRVTSSAPKIGLWVFLAVVSSLFGILRERLRDAAARRARRDHDVGAAQRAERALVQHDRYSCSRAARCRSHATARTATTSAACAPTSRVAGVLTVLFLAGQVLAWEQVAAAGDYDPGNPAYTFFILLTAVHGLHLLGGMFVLTRTTARVWRGVDKLAVVTRGKTSLERAALHDVLALAAADLARPVRVAVVDLEGKNGAMAQEGLSAAGRVSEAAGKPSSPTGPRTSRRSECRGARR